MLRKVYICGAHSTGKTTLFESLRKQLNIENVKLIYFPEVFRRVAAEKKFREKELENMDCVKELLLQSYDDQIKQEVELQEKEAENKAGAVFDRSLVDIIAALELTFQKSFNEYIKRTDALKNVESLREENCLVFIIKPVEKIFEYDGVRPKTTRFSDVQLLDAKIRDTMKSLQIPIVDITMEDLQERTDLVVDEIFKRWPELKRVNNTQT